MTQQPDTPEADPLLDVETRLRAEAQQFPYPPTPELLPFLRTRLRRRVIRRRALAWAAAITLIALCGLLAVPQVRAAVIEVIRIGVIRIFVDADTPTPANATPLPTPLGSILDLAGQTSLTDARERFGYPIGLPADYGPPDYVFLQTYTAPYVVLVWIDPAQPGRVRLSLHLLGPGVDAHKGRPTVLATAWVNGRSALWTSGPYMLQIEASGRLRYEFRRLISGNVLLWTNGPLTYRLESGLSLADAVRVAESIR